MSYPGSGEPDNPEDFRPAPGQPSTGSGEHYGQQPGQYGNQPSPYGNQYGGQYGRQGYGGQPGQYGGQQPGGEYGHPGQSGQPSGTNLLAILSLVFAFVFAPAGIVLGHLALRQIGRTGERGRQLALGGLILSYLFTALALVGCCGWLALAGWAGSDGGGNAR